MSLLKQETAFEDPLRHFVVATSLSCSLSLDTNNTVTNYP